MRLEEIIKGLSQKQQKSKKSTIRDSYNCDKCKDTGFIQHIKKDGSTSYSFCSCRKENKTRKIWAKSGIADLTASFNKFEKWNESSVQIYNVAVEYYKNFKNIKSSRQNSIMLLGQPGSGKTYISLALANNFITQQGIEVIYMPYRNVVTNLKQMMINKQKYEVEIEKFQQAEILLIDDMFKGKISETDINLMFEIINHRYLNCLPVIVSSELTVDKLLNIDEAIGSRLYEMCKGHIVEITGIENNYRLR